MSKGNIHHHSSRATHRKNKELSGSIPSRHNKPVRISNQYTKPVGLLLICCFISYGVAGNYKSAINNSHNKDTIVKDADRTAFQSTSSELIVIPDQCNSPSRGQFDKIYKEGHWGMIQQTPSDFYGNAEWPTPESRMKSASGEGSNLGYNTVASLKIIKDTIVKYSVKTMVDMPCGDVNWILDSFETDSLPLYVGLDITSAVVKVNKQRFAHHTNKRFYFWDATQCILPRIRYGESEGTKPFDLVHVRDVIQHMSLDQGVKYFCNVFESGAKVLITTTYNKGKNNQIAEGGWYENNLSEEPFSFPKNVTCIHTHQKTEKDDTCVYDLLEPWVKAYIEKKC